MPPILRRTPHHFLGSRSKNLTWIISRYFGSDKDIKLPPEPTTCCMSGCANCVWIEYAKELSELFDGNDEEVQKIVLEKIKDPNLKAFLQMELKNIAANKRK